MAVWEVLTGYAFWKTYGAKPKISYWLEDLSAVPLFMVVYWLIDVFCVLLFRPIGRWALRKTSGEQFLKENPKRVKEFTFHAVNVVDHGANSLLILYSFWRDRWFWPGTLALGTMFHQHKRNEFWLNLFYNAAIGQYMFKTWQEVIVLFKKGVSKTWYLFMFHHLVTLGLLIGSYFDGYLEFGIMVLFTHVTPDVFMYLSRMFNDVKYMPPQYLLFPLCVLAWILFRCVMFPVWVIGAGMLLCTRSWRLSGVGTLILVILKIFLYILNVFWLYELGRVGHGIMTKKAVLDETLVEKKKPTKEDTMIEETDDGLSSKTSDLKTFFRAPLLPLSSLASNRNDKETVNSEVGGIGFDADFLRTLEDEVSSQASHGDSVRIPSETPVPEAGRGERSLLRAFLPDRCFLLWFWVYAFRYCVRRKGTSASLPLRRLPFHSDISHLHNDQYSPHEYLAQSKSLYRHVFSRIFGPFFISAALRVISVVSWCLVPIALRNFLILLNPLLPPGDKEKMDHFSRILPASHRPANLFELFRPNDTDCWSWLVCLGVAHWAGLVFEQLSLYWSGVAGLRAQSVLMDVVFGRMLIVASSSQSNRDRGGKAKLGRGKKSKGEIVNYVGVDAENVRLGLEHLHAVWAVVPVICVCLYYLVQILRWAVAVCLGVVVVLIGGIVWVTILAGKFRRRHSIVSDERVALTTEVVSKLPILKYFAWEDHYANRILKRILTEDRMTSIALSLKSFNYSLIQCIIYLSLAAAFVSLYFVTGSLDPIKVFTGTAVFGILGIAVSALPKAVGFLVSMFDSFRRLAEFVNHIDTSAETGTETGSGTMGTGTGGGTEVVQLKGDGDESDEESLDSEEQEIDSVEDDVADIRLFEEEIEIETEETGVEIETETDPSQELSSSSPSPSAFSLSTLLDVGVAAEIRHGWFEWGGSIREADSDGDGNGEEQKEKEEGKVSLRTSPPIPIQDDVGFPGMDIEGERKRSKRTSEVSSPEGVNLPSLKVEVPKTKPSRFLVEGAGAGPEAETPLSLTDRGCVLKDISIQIPKGRLTMVVGKVGSGKTSLVRALLGELSFVQGETFRPFSIGSDERRDRRHDRHRPVAYCDQKCWIQSGTVRENILFGLPEDPDRLSAVISVCCLEADLVQLPAGLDSEVTECGSNLSGGQKVRISLARACYRRSVCDAFLLDDVLGAVDPRVATRLFHDCVVRYLAGTTRILVLHQLRFAPFADFVVIMDEGRILDVGSYEDLVKRGSLSCSSPTSPEPAEAGVHTFPREMESVGVLGVPVVSTFVGVDASNLNLDSDLEDEGKLVDFGALPVAGALVGKRKKSVLREFVCFHPRSVWLLLAMVLLVTLGGIIVNCASLFLSQWTAGRYVAKQGSGYLARYVDLAANVSEDMVAAMDPSLVPYPYDSDFCPVDYPFVCREEMVELFWDRSYGNGTVVKEGLQGISMVAIYSTLLATGLFAIFLRGWLGQLIFVVMSSSIHKTAIQRVLKAPISFFHRTPIGVILARFTVDVHASLNRLPNELLLVMQQIVVCLVFSFFVCYATYGYTIFVVVAAWIAYISFYLLYRSAAIQVDKSVVASKNPILSLVSETYDGLTTIRSYWKERSFVRRFRRLMRHHATVVHMRSAAERWVGSSFGIVSSTMTFFASAVIVLLTYRGTFWWGTGKYEPDPNLMPLSVVMGFSLSIFIPQLTSLSVLTEIELGSVKRVLDYAIRLPSESEVAEGQFGNRTRRPPVDWPRTGDVVYENVEARHGSEFPLVLKKTNFVVESGRAVGLVGRTGSGKSTIMQALMRFFELEGGKIVVDGVDISTIPLKTLRSKIAIIPQDPVLFTGSIRENLDPCNICADVAIWEALEAVSMASAIRQFPEQLEVLVGRSDASFSLGEKQLLCLARAILRKPRIVLLDEINANVDLETDRLMQEALQRCFDSCTRLTIAHRVSSLASCDRIMLLEKGVIVDEASPRDLVFRLDEHEAFREFLSEESGDLEGIREKLGCTEY